MPTSAAYRQLDLSGALQSATSHVLRKRNEVEETVNAAYNIKIGSAVRRPGYEQVGNTLQHGNDSLGLHIFKYGTNNKVVAGINNSDGTNATLRFLDSFNWTNIITDAAPNTQFNPINYLDEMYVAGKSDNNVYLTLQNVDYTLTASTTRNVLNAPKCEFVAEYNGRLYAINCEVNGVRYSDRAYQSSPALGAVTFVQTDQVGSLQQLRVDSVKYLKPGMNIDIYGAGGDNLKVNLQIISVDKKNNRISFAPFPINVADNDEIWLAGRKNKLSILWNTDHPTPESADWIKIPAGKDETPEITGWGKNNNRLFLFTRNSVWKFDGSNLIAVSESIGCVSHQTIRNIGPWLVWLHNTGVYAHNDSTGQIQKLSRAIDNYIAAINPSKLKYASAGTVGNVYKLAVGELLTLDSETTSTSTSSTSTSSTSSSTSSTSTSSTSTSSTSTSRSFTTSTSMSTSSTSTSVSNTTSTSSTSSSTSTTTAAPARQISRLIYDFDMNSWWEEKHRREIRRQINHTMNGYTKPYFTDDTGRLFRDETGLKDHNDSIPMRIKLGRNNFGSDLTKNYLTGIVVSERARGTQISASVDDGEWVSLGEIYQPNQKIDYPNLRGVDINYQFTHNDTGEAPVIDGITTFHSREDVTT